MNDDASIDLRKAALLLASIPDEEAAYLLSHLDDEQTAMVHRSIAQLQSVLSVEQDILASELRGLQDIAPHNDLPSIASPATDSAIDTICRVDPTVIVSVLRHELAQTVGIVLSQLPIDVAAIVMSHLPTSQQIDVVLRMSETTTVDEEIVTILLSEIAEQVDIRSRVPRCSGGTSRVAHLISCTDHATEESLLANLTAEDAGLAERIAQRMELIRQRRQPTRLSGWNEGPLHHDIDPIAA